MYLRERRRVSGRVNDGLRSAIAHRRDGFDDGLVERDVDDVGRVGVEGPHAREGEPLDLVGEGHIYSSSMRTHIGVGV